MCCNKSVIDMEGSIEFHKGKLFFVWVIELWRVVWILGIRIWLPVLGDQFHFESFFLFSLQFNITWSCNENNTVWLTLVYLKNSGTISFWVYTILSSTKDDLNCFEKPVFSIVVFMFSVPFLLYDLVTFLLQWTEFDKVIL